MRAIVILLTFAACTPTAPKRTLGPFLRSAEITNGTLVLERCTIVLDGDRVEVGSCNFDRKPLCAPSP